MSTKLDMVNVEDNVNKTRYGKCWRQCHSKGALLDFKEAKSLTTSSKSKFCNMSFSIDKRAKSNNLNCAMVDSQGRIQKKIDSG